MVFAVTYISFLSPGNFYRIDVQKSLLLLLAVSIALFPCQAAVP